MIKLISTVKDTDFKYLKIVQLGLLTVTKLVQISKVKSSYSMNILPIYISSSYLGWWKGQKRTYLHCSNCHPGNHNFFWRVFCLAPFSSWEIDTYGSFVLISDIRVYMYETALWSGWSIVTDVVSIFVCGTFKQMANEVTGIVQEFFTKNFCYKL